MRTIGLLNWKGGVGKTTLSLHLACGLAEYFDHLRVLFLDTDKQGNASEWFGAVHGKPTLADILRREAGARDVIQHTRYPHIDILPANAELLDVNIEILRDGTGRQDNILKEALKPVQSDYDLCIIDNPPDSSIPVLNGLALVDDLLAVVVPDAFAVQGIRVLQREIDNYNEYLGLGLAIKGVILNRRTAFDFDIFQELRKSYRMLPAIRGGKNTQQWLDKVINTRRSIFELSPRSGYAQDVKKLIEKLVELIEAEYTGVTVL